MVLIKSDGGWVPAVLTSFESEAALQRLLHQDPSLIPGCEGAAVVQELDKTSMNGIAVGNNDTSSSMEDADSEARLLKAYEIVSAHYRQDISLFWTRSSVFLIVQVGLLALVSAVIDKDVGTVSAFAVMGIGVSVVWFLVARSAVEWMEAWRVQTVEIDHLVNPLKSYRIDSAPPRNVRLARLVVAHPAQIGQLLPVVFILGWTVLLLTR